jgi:hypothetical protein
MRQGQQNRRGRGRSNNNNNNSNHSHTHTHSHNSGRKLESSGPDVKIRGTAAQIAEKYIALARDASSSGDSVMAENYLQHAEHYNRIIMAAQAQAVAQHPNGGEPGHGMNGHHRPHPENTGNFAMREQPQPVIEEPQPEVAAEPAAAASDATTDTAAAARGEPADGRRRRRRYPAGGAAAGRAGSTAAAEPAANANGHNGTGNGHDNGGEGHSPDEALAN